MQGYLMDAGLFDGVAPRAAQMSRKWWCTYECVAKGGMAQVMARYEYLQLISRAAKPRTQPSPVMYHAPYHDVM